jgi:hypothetical protein
VKIISTAGYMSIEDILVRGAETLASLEGIGGEKAETIIQSLKHHREIGDLKPVAPAIIRDADIAEEGESEEVEAESTEINEEDQEVGDKETGPAEDK